jgi:hypothetical protein
MYYVGRNGTALGSEALRKAADYGAAGCVLLLVF